MEVLMKLCGIRGLILTAVPLALAAAMLSGPMAGAANALPRGPDCLALWMQVDDAYDQADMYARDALAADNRGDWLAWGYYSALAADWNLTGDDLMNNALAVGC
jgi:hypothetical protein